MDTETTPDKEATETADYLSPFIEDGYTERHTIPASPGRWSAVEIRYRPLSAEDDSLVYARKAINQSSLAREYAAVMVGDLKAGTPPRLLDWDVKDRSGNRVKISIDNLCAKLPPDFFDALLQVLLGRAKDDVKN